MGTSKALPNWTFFQPRIFLIQMIFAFMLNPRVAVSKALK